MVGLVAQHSLLGQPCCPVCLDTCVRPAITPCGHRFCASCLVKALVLDRLLRCPQCRATLQATGWATYGGHTCEFRYHLSHYRLQYPLT